jgi:hypothetical protein
MSKPKRLTQDHAERLAALEGAGPRIEGNGDVAELLRLVLMRMEEFEQRLAIIEQVKVQLVQGVTN